jgi:gamma-glutamylcyclotransferase (GGCT)/AIG2-like uncharacterized protein YtfP
MTVSLFVYGTLMTGERTAGLLGDCRRQPARVRGQMYRLPAGYPAIRLGGDALVHGELVSGFEARRLGVLDQYEGVNQGLYRRVEVTALCGLERVRAWAWVMDDPYLRGGVLLEAGRWKAGRLR